MQSAVAKADLPGGPVSKTAINRQNPDPVERKGAQDPDIDTTGAVSGTGTNEGGGDEDVQGSWQDVSKLFPAMVWYRGTRRPYLMWGALEFGIPSSVWL